MNKRFHAAARTDQAASCARVPELAKGISRIADRLAILAERSEQAQLNRDAARGLLAEAVNAVSTPAPWQA